MNVVYDGSINATQQALIEQAIAVATFPWDRLFTTVTFYSLPEPSCPGHQDYMCTHGTDDGYAIEIRDGVESSDHPANGSLGREATARFFRESIVHELGHVVTFTVANSDALRTQMASWFVRDTTFGALVDWNPLGAPWPDRVQEGAAEFFKDLYMPRSARVYNTRSAWKMDYQHFGNWMALMETITCPTDFTSINWGPGADSYLGDLCYPQPGYRSYPGVGLHGGWPGATYSTPHPVHPGEVGYAGPMVSTEDGWVALNPADADGLRVTFTLHGVYWLTSHGNPLESSGFFEVGGIPPGDVFTFQIGDQVVTRDTARAIGMPVLPFLSNTVDYTFRFQQDLDASALAQQAFDTGVAPNFLLELRNSSDDLADFGINDPFNERGGFTPVSFHFATLEWRWAYAGACPWPPWPYAGPLSLGPARSGVVLH